MKNKGISTQARILHSALLQKNITVEIEKWDTHKHIDLSVDEAKFYIEIDGDSHYTDSTKILTDLKRDNYSTKDGYDTFRIPNHTIDNQLEKVVTALIKVIKERTFTSH